MIKNIDGDQVSARLVWSKEANAEADRWIDSNGYILNMAGKTMRPLEKDFLLCQYNLTKANMERITKDCNATPVKYAV